MDTRKLVGVSLAGLGLLVLVAGPAQAFYHMNPYGFWYGGHGINVTVEGTPHNNIGIGSLHAKISGHEANQPVYCLDLYHSFNWGQNWDVELYIIPPDPFPGGVPHNTDQAAWIYNEYGLKTQANTSAKAEGVQLALWEVSHDLDWFANYSSGTWYSTDDFQYAGGGTRLTEATTILDALWAKVDAGETLGYSAAYYHPIGSTYGQGFIGDGGEVPEPASILLIGVSLLGAAGAGVLRRRNR